MLYRSKLLLAAFVAVVVLSVGAATANAARSFSVINNTLLTYVSPGLTIRGNPEGNMMVCSVTLTASLHSSFAKIRGSLMGFVNGGDFGRCINAFGTFVDGSMLVEHRKPWHITLQSFRGTLPRITEILILINNIRILVTENEPIFRRRLGCLYQINAALETSGRTGAAEYTVQGFIGQRGNVALLFEDGLNEAIVPCETSGESIGTFTVTLPPTFRLI